LIADPFTFAVDLMLRHLNESSPGTLVTGGLASGGSSPGETRLFLDRDVFDSGAVGVRIDAGVEAITLVSQGCRPIGESYTVTRGDQNVIHELAGKPPMEIVRDLYLRADPKEQRLMQQGLHIGRVIDEYKSEFDRGDFLIRAVVGADAETGAIAIGDRVTTGETVQFHVRDAPSAHEDLDAALARAREVLGGRSPAGALLFTCNGRGSRLFPAAGHDASMIAEQLGSPPLAGFFCAGEIGPVGGKNFLHGFTASMVLFADD